ncbi:hypothetical protein BJX64DRAFT_265749 [Aspergillus heterothallicus]
MLRVSSPLASNPGSILACSAWDRQPSPSGVSHVGRRASLRTDRDGCSIDDGVETPRNQSWVGDNVAVAEVD